MLKEHRKCRTGAKYNFGGGARARDAVLIHRGDFDQLPLTESIRSRTRKEDSRYDEATRYPHRGLPRSRILRKIVPSYLGKPFNDLYSFISMTWSGLFREQMLEDLKIEFGVVQICIRDGKLFNDFYVDEQGLCQKVEEDKPHYRYVAFARSISSVPCVDDDYVFVYQDDRWWEFKLDRRSRYAYGGRATWSGYLIVKRSLAIGVQVNLIEKYIANLPRKHVATNWV